MKFVRILLLVLSVGAFGWALANHGQQPIELRNNCPPSFELQKGACMFVHTYLDYEPLAEIASLVQPLPAARDGFSPAQIDLGRYLFFDPILSKDGSVSCAHCHHPELAFADGLGQSLGVNGRGVGPKRRGGARLPRGAPTLWNVGFYRKLFWDGRAATLEEQLDGPLFSPIEMANTPQNLEATLNANADYQRLFATAFTRDRNERITLAEVKTAIIAFEGTLISLDSRYDQYMLGDRSALDDEERRGFELFHSFALRCAHCHVPPLTTDVNFTAIGAPEPEGNPFDAGAAASSGDPVLHGAFRTPPLRGVTETAPYMHSGGHLDLREAVEFYNKRRGHAVPEGEQVLLHWHIYLTGPIVSDADIDAVTSFLAAFSDESLLPDVPIRVPSGLKIVGSPDD